MFIVHGHDEELKQTTARFLERLNLNPVILHEQADRGRALLQKFRDHAIVSFAVALFTPDDLGEVATKVKVLEDLKFRARQNVVLEFGYFVGTLPEGYAVALVKGDVDLPSDLAGVLYIRVDDGGSWKYWLVKELQAAGFDVDANRVL